MIYLNQIVFSDRECILLCDFNTNVLLSPKKSTLVNALYNFNQLFGLKQLIVEPTRVCIDTKSTLDLIIVSDQENICQSGVLNIGFSDHMVTYCTRKKSKILLEPGNKYMKVRSMKQYSKERFVTVILTVETRQDTKWKQHYIEAVNDNLHLSRKLWKMLKDICLKTPHKVQILYYWPGY
jgi:hypothetical protein